MSEIKHSGSETHDFPEYLTYWQLVGRYTVGGEWFGSGQLRRTESEAVEDQQNWKYVEPRLIKIRLPLPEPPK